MAGHAKKCVARYCELANKTTQQLYKVSTPCIDDHHFVLLKHGCQKIPNWECLFVHREKGLFLSVYVDDIKLAGKKHNIDPMWKVLNKEVDLGEPTSFLGHVYLGSTQKKDNVRQVKKLWTITEPCSNREFLR